MNNHHKVPPSWAGATKHGRQQQRRRLTRTAAAWIGAAVLGGALHAAYVWHSLEGSGLLGGNGNHPTLLLPQQQAKPPAAAAVPHADEHERNDDDNDENDDKEPTVGSDSAEAGRTTRRTDTARATTNTSSSNNNNHRAWHGGAVDEQFQRLYQQVMEQKRQREEEALQAMHPSDREGEYWKRHGCFYVENLCHSAYRWFYDDSPPQTTTTDTNSTTNNATNNWQPKFILDLTRILARGYPRKVRVEPRIPKFLQDQCPYSPISHHLVFTTPFNDMMVEFYIRTMTGLQPILAQHATLTPNHLQLYLLVYNHGTMYDGHRLFANALPSNNALLKLHALLDHTRCQCLRHAVFCGFTAQPYVNYHNVTTETTLVRPYQDIGGVGIFRDKRRYAGLRTQVRQQLLGPQQTVLPQMILAHRRKLVRSFGFRNATFREANEDWRIVGLCQRNGRRIWNNLDVILENCNQRYNASKILCVEVNMDKETAHTVQQAIQHGALDAFVGIHGSHFVNAVLLKPQAYILELLAWFPDFMPFGREWARRTDIPTPIGAMFHDSDLNHLGFLLGRSSAPQLCNTTIAVGDGNVTDTACLIREMTLHKKAVWWGTRDFTVDERIVQSFLEHYILQRPVTCDEFEERRRQSRLVVDGRLQEFTPYNFNCVDNSDDTEPKPRHSYTNYTIEEEARLKIIKPDLKALQRQVWKELNLTEDDAANLNAAADQEGSYGGGGGGGGGGAS